MTKKRTTRKVTVQSPTEIIARNREIDNNIDVEAMSPDTKQTRTRLSI